MLTISERHADEARRVVNRLRSEGFRIELDDSDATIGKKIRMHRRLRPAYLAVIGDEEVEHGTLAARDRAGQQVTMSHQAVIDGLRSEIDSRAMGSSLIPSAE